MNIKFVLHVGDLANWDTADHIQFIRVDEGFRILDAAKIPYAIAIGNHDSAAVKKGGSAAPGNVNLNLRNTSTFNKYFPTKRFPFLTGTYQPGKMDNSYQTFKAGGLNWLVLTLELWPRKEPVDWGKTVLEKYPDHNVIVVTHSHLTNKGDIEKRNGGYGDNSPQYVFDQLIKQYANVRMVFSGHVGGHGYRTDKGVHGNMIYQFLQCYHDRKGNPVRFLEIDTSAGTMKSYVYSPFTKETKKDGSTMAVTNVKWVSKKQKEN